MFVPDLVSVGRRCHVARLKSGDDPDNLDGRPEPRKQRRWDGILKVRPRQSRLAALDTESTTPATLEMPGFDPARWPPEAQSFLFGHCRLAITGDADNATGWTLPDSPDWRVTTEILFYADNLPASAVALLQKIHRERTARMGDGREPRDLPGVTSYCWPLARFLDWLYCECIRKPTLICGYNLPYDLGRIAASVGPAKTSTFRGGFSFQLWADPESPDDYNAERPRVWIKSLATAEPLLGFGVENRRGNGKLKEKRISTKTESELWDLQRYMYYRTGDVLGLAGAAEVLGIKDVKLHPERHGVIDAAYVGYSRQDTALTLNVALAALRDVDRNDWSRGNRGTVPETRLVSPASGTKRNFDAMGVGPRLAVQPNFPPEVLGAAMEGFYGGLVLTPFRGELPIVYGDITSCYPTVAVLLNLWSLWTAATVKVVDVTDEIRALLATATRDELLRPELWPRLNCLCLIDVDDADLLPVRYQADPDSSEWSLSRAYRARGTRPFWYCLPDPLASKILTGKTPNVIRALRFVGVGKQSTLKPIKLGGVVDFDPRSMDYFKVCVEERYRVAKGMPPYTDLDETEREALAYGLKLSSNAAAYGLSVEVNRRRLAVTGHRKKVEHVGVWTGSDNEGDTYFPAELHTVEAPGSHYFPPLGGLATSGARLLVALAEALARECDEGYRGTVALSDTDSVVFAAAKERKTITLDNRGERLAVMGWEDVDRVRARMNALNPYDRDVIPDVLKLEDVNFIDEDPTKPRRELWADVISPKRYCMYTTAPWANWPADLPIEWSPEDPTRRAVVEWKESALGGYLPPATDSKGKPLTDKDWRKRMWEAHVRGEDCPFAATPAVKRTTIASWDVFERFAAYNQGKPYARQIKPFNFLLTVREIGNGDENRTLVAPYDPNTGHWLDLPWLDYATGDRVPITTRWQDSDVPLPHATASVVCWDAVWRSYFSHPVLTMRDHEGRICRPATRGKLTPRTVRASDIVYLGKESRELGRQEADLPPAEDEDGDGEYGRVGTGIGGEWAMALEIVDDVPAEICAELAISREDRSNWRRGVSRPNPSRERQIVREINYHAFRTLGVFGIEAPDHRPNRLAMYLETVPGLVERTRERLRRLVLGRNELRAAKAVEVKRSTLQHWLAGDWTIPVIEAMRVWPKLDALGIARGDEDDEMGRELTEEELAEQERYSATALAAWEAAHPLPEVPGFDELTIEDFMERGKAGDG